MTDRNVIFWLPEGPLLAVKHFPERAKAQKQHAYIIYIEDLNPEVKTRWALSRKEIFKIALSLFLFAIRGR